MSSLVPLTLEDGTVILVQAQDDVEAPEMEIPSDGEVMRTPKGPTRSGAAIPEAAIASLQGTIKGYTRHIMSAFEGGPITPMGNGRVGKVTLEFGVTVAGKAGIPYITEASATGSLKVTVECTWPEDKGSANPSV
ncbi:MAG: CU044_2847 family protein [Cyanobacteria bacterium J06598_1]